MNFITQLGLLAIILVILVILIKSNQTLEQIYMEGETVEKTKEVMSFKVPEVNFTSMFKHKTKEKVEDITVEKVVDRSPHTIPVEQCSDWYVEMTDIAGRSFGRMGIKECPFTIGRATDNDYVIDDLSWKTADGV